MVGKYLIYQIPALVFECILVALGHYATRNILNLGGSDKSDRDLPTIIILYMDQKSYVCE